MAAVAGTVLLTGMVVVVGAAVTVMAVAMAAAAATAAEEEVMVAAAVPYTVRAAKAVREAVGQLPRQPARRFTSP
jgi:hypothetical protein